MWQHCTLLILATASTVLAGVFPNYHAHFDFVTWNDEKKLQDYEAASKWWQTASFYQIYPRSFKDSDGDGVGDLKGITEKLDYLKEINITATWLSPIFKSPMADFGYDIANFYEIDPLFGSMQDFENLMKKAQQLGIKIILDFVPNHSSDECEWFKRSAEKDPFYKDFYIWHPGKIIDGVRHPPTNWVSVFRGSAWEWHEGRQEYYFHQFVKKQPDLNYRNPIVQATMKDVLRFWLHKGVAGFRIDAVPHIFERAPDAEGNLPDEPRNPSVQDPDDYGYLQHIYTVDQPETIDLVYQWRQVLDDFKYEFGGEDRIIMAETYSPISVVMQYYGNATMEGAQIPFNFLLISSLTNNSNAYNYADIIHNWLDNMPEGRTANWVLGNHDKNRVASRLGTDRIDMLNMLILTLPGCSVTYNGEEIGMKDVWISWNDTVDPSACNSNPDIYETLSRDPERTPFQWNRDAQSGFSTANKTWLPVAPDYWDVNMEWEKHQPSSHLNIFKNIQSFVRNQPAIKYGQTQVMAVNQNVLAVKRYLLHEFTYITLINIFDNEETVDLQKTLRDVPAEMVYVLVTPASKAKRNDHVKTNSITLQPKDAVILKSTGKLTTTVGYFTYYKAD
ncbi:maltase A3-like [Lucilia sericata]|uniref:maltase A3-like n=1 Tax=Lucilia sericata TaxID=13632 RepID=UPI0018A85B38|nr:maltase A3-like [Lucilia sericata]